MIQWPSMNKKNRTISLRIHILDINFYILFRSNKIPQIVTPLIYITNSILTTFIKIKQGFPLKRYHLDKNIMTRNRGGIAVSYKKKTVLLTVFIKTISRTVALKWTEESNRRTFFLFYFKEYAYFVLR
jgi:hypothetical protein